MYLRMLQVYTKSHNENVRLRKSVFQKKKKKKKKIDEDQSLKTHKKQTHYCSWLYKEERQKFFN